MTSVENEAYDKIDEIFLKYLFLAVSGVLRLYVV